MNDNNSLQHRGMKHLENFCIEDGSMPKFFKWFVPDVGVSAPETDFVVVFYVYNFESIFHWFTVKIEHFVWNENVAKIVPLKT